MTADEFAAMEERLQAEVFERVQGGRVGYVPRSPKPARCFADRAIGFDVRLLGTYGPPD